MNENRLIGVVVNIHLDNDTEKVGVVQEFDSRYIIIIDDREQVFMIPKKRILMMQVDFQIHSEQEPAPEKETIPESLAIKSSSEEHESKSVPDVEGSKQPLCAEDLPHGDPDALYEKMGTDGRRFGSMPGDLFMGQSDKVLLNNEPQLSFGVGFDGGMIFETEDGDSDSQEETGETPAKDS